MNYKQYAIFQVDVHQYLLKTQLPHMDSNDQNKALEISSCCMSFQFHHTHEHSMTYQRCGTCKNSDDQVSYEFKIILVNKRTY